jgi:hypothetical protein
MTPYRQRALVTVLIGLGLITIGFFGLRTIHAFREFRNHRPPPAFKDEQPETDVELIRDWMTIPFIGRMYHVPPSVIFEALEIPMKRDKNLEKSLKQLNDEYYPDASGFVEAKVKETVLKNMPLSAPSAPAAPTMPGAPTP